MSSDKAIRGQLLYFVDDPATAGEAAWVYHADGIIWIESGRIRLADDAQQVLPHLPRGTEIDVLEHHLLVPGFIDTHIHYPQTEMVAAYGERLLEWLETYTFPVESKFSDPDYAAEIATIFLDELLRNGTTTALVFGTVHPESVDAFFSEAQRRKLRMIAGKVMMDRNAPEYICDEAEQSYRDSKALIQRWHGIDRLQYAVTPRFAPTSSDRQLALAGRLLREHPGLYLHTHLAENPEECAWVAELFPHSKHYLDVYDRAGLLTRRSVFAHGIHLCDDSCKRLSDTGAAIAHCPTSNLFLGSGLFELDRLTERGVNIGMGTDVGGGTSFSMLQTLADAYKIQQLRGRKLDPFRALYLATLGGARALDLEDKIGSFRSGCEADLVALDLHATPFLKFRTARCRSLFEMLFVLNTLGDDRAIARTWILGEVAHSREV
ncbi:guanine deaminase [Marinobacterium zhoushanense]|uniref:Guanine deaminase n=1 Tax=Marinobacterium zhoushanense TaxID=1679163 RepID=A0ABQ1KDJ5_9GAMM|nr:guanine deaminase [Marinobacterium zhoushanense]GGB92284.1 guanine deaminase [Marinobacterium zhoushanense]